MIRTTASHIHTVALGGVTDMVTIKRGDMVKAEGTELHIKESEDGEITYWAADIDDEFTESFESFVDRCKQSGGIIIEFGEGKYDCKETRKNKERFVEIA